MVFLIKWLDANSDDGSITSHECRDEWMNEQVTGTSYGHSNTSVYILGPRDWLFVDLDELRVDN